MYGSKKKMMGGGMTPMKPMKNMGYGGGMDKKLVGGQVKMDKNKNGKLDSQDFKMMREMKPGGMVDIKALKKENKMRRSMPRGY